MSHYFDRVTFEEDSRQRHQGTLTVKDEDHTLGNCVRHQLLLDKRVRFAGYKKPHPLEEYIEVKVQTTGEVSPPQAVVDACDTLIAKMSRLSTSLLAQVQLMKGTTPGLVPSSESMLMF